MKSWLRRNWWWLTLIGVAVIAAGILISIFRSNPFCEFVVTFFDDWSVALSAGAAVILAFAAFLTIQEANAREKRRIEEERRQKEKDIDRNFRSQSINGIIEWALELTNPRFKIPLVVTKKEPWVLIPELEQLATRNIWVKDISKSFEKSFQTNVEKSTEDLNAYISALNKWHYGDGEIKYGELSNAHSALEDSIKDVLEDAFKIKAREKL